MYKWYIKYDSSSHSINWEGFTVINNNQWSRWNERLWFHRGNPRDTLAQLLTTPHIGNLFSIWSFGNAANTEHNQYKRSIWDINNRMMEIPSVWIWNLQGIKIITPHSESVTSWHCHYGFRGGLKRRVFLRTTVFGEIFIVLRNI